MEICFHEMTTSLSPLQNWCCEWHTD